MAITQYVILSVLTMAGLHGYHIDVNNEEEGLLDVLQGALMEYMDENLEVKDPTSGYATWDRSSCVWKSHGHGKNNFCDSGYVAVGACQSGKNLDCGRSSTRIYCCKTGRSGNTVFPLQATCEHDWQAKDTGEIVQCPMGKVVGGLCGSGHYPQCWAAHKQYHHKILCCTHGAKYTLDRSPSTCEWVDSGWWGKDLICPTNMLMVGECGSASKKDCLFRNSIYLTQRIRCCPFKLTSTP